MDNTVFTEFEFWALIAFSFVFPLSIYALLLSKRVISRWVVLLFGLALVGIAGVDVYLLQSLASLAKLTHSLLDEKVFLSEVSLALYLLPAMFGGVGINLVSHVLVNHLLEAEKRFKDEHPGRWRCDKDPEGVSIGIFFHGPRNRKYNCRRPL